MVKSGCLYCDKGENIVSDNDDVNITLTKNVLEVEDLTAKPFSFYIETEINYCPICGRNLNGKTDKEVKRSAY